MTFARSPGLWALAASVLFLSTPAARAQGEPQPEGPRHYGGQRSFGFGPIVGYGGAGATVGALFAPVGLWMSGGYVPLFVFGNKHDLTRSLTFDAFSSAQVNFDVSILPILSGKRIDAGFIAGYRYSTLLLHGVGAGVALTYDLTKTLAIFLSVECGIFPQAESQLSAAGYPTDRDAAIPWFQGGGNVGLLIFRELRARLALVVVVAGRLAGLSFGLRKPVPVLRQLLRVVRRSNAVEGRGKVDNAGPSKHAKGQGSATHGVLLG